MIRRSPGERPRGRRLATALAVVLGAGLLTVPAASPAQATDPVPRRIMSGWIPYWTPYTGTAAVVDNADLFTDVSPFWYSAQWSGTASSLLEQVGATAKTDTLASLRAAGVKVLPSITDGMPARQMAAVMADPALRAAFVAQIVALAVGNGYDGVDLDFERFAFGDGTGTWATTRPSWVTFVAELSTALHAQGKLLSATTPPLYNANRDSTSGYWVYDWAGIAPYVDRLRIMAYDYSVSGGHIAPLPWVEKITAFAVTQAPSGKIQLGIPAYGRNATVKVNGASKVLPSTSACPTNRPTNYLDTLSFTAANALTAIPSSATTSPTVDRTKAVRTWDAVNAEVGFTYQVTYKGTTADGVTPTTCTVYRSGWYDHGASALARAQLVEKYQLLGVAQWTLGGQDDTQWAKLRSFAATIAPTPTAVSVYVAPTTTFGTAASVTARAVNEGLPVGGATAVLYARPVGGTSWTAVAKAPTGADGRVKLPHTVKAATQYKVNVAGDWRRATGSGTAATGVRTAVAIAVTSTPVKAGTVVPVGLKLKPWIKGQTVKLQQLKSGVWKTLASGTADRYGRVAFTVTPAARARVFQYRVYAVASGAVRGSYTSFTVTTS